MLSALVIFTSTVIYTRLCICCYTKKIEKEEAKKEEVSRLSLHAGDARMMLG